MSHDHDFSSPDARDEAHSVLSPLFHLLGIMENRLDEAEQRLLEDDLLAACPPAPENLRSETADSVPGGEARRPLRIIQVQGEEPVAYYDEQDIPPEFADNAVKLGNLAAWEPLFAFQAAFQLLERRYPLRAAALYLRSLTRIWVELVEKNTLDLMRDDDFLRLYLKALLQVEAIAARCERCAQREDADRP